MTFFRRFLARIHKWRTLSSEFAKSGQQIRAEDMPGFPLIPASKGFCISLEKAVLKFRECLAQAGINLAGEEGDVKDVGGGTAVAEKFAQVVHPDDV